MLNTTLKGNVLTVVTPITKEVAEKTFSPMVAKDDKGNEVCIVTLDKNGKGSISAYGLVCNTIVEGKLAVQMIMPMETTMEDVKKKYGLALVEVNKYIDEIADAANKEIEAVNGIFGQAE